MAAELATTAVAVRQPTRALVAADAVQEQQEQRRLIGEYVKGQLVPGTDYGVIPGTAKPTLLKPGAEKLTQLFRCVPRLRLDEKVENWDTGLFHYRFTCQIVTQADELVVAEGVGSASTFESRYRWRQADRRCPHCGAGAIIKGKADFGGGWLCFKKKGGCGAKFEDADRAITSQEVGRVQNPDLLDQVNTVLKVAKKRALVDAALSLARCSDIFTQDAEDLADGEAAVADARPAVKSGAAATKPAPAGDPASHDAALDALVNAGDLDTLAAVWKDVYRDRHRFSADEWESLTAGKNRRKADLTPPPAGAPPAAPKPAPAPANVPPPPAKPPTRGVAVESCLALLDRLAEEGVDEADVDTWLVGKGVMDRAAVEKLPPTAALDLSRELEAWLAHERRLNAAEAAAHTAA